jgi:hypothetical protein
MFGNYYYHQRIRKSVSAFGAMFNDIYVIRKNSGGDVISTLKVPLSYGPRAKFLDRIRENADLATDTKVAIKLPRMAFEITNISYAPERQLPRIGQKHLTSAIDPTKKTKIFQGVPYILSFQLSCFAKNQDDALQIVEQILPYFPPQYNLAMKPFDDYPQVKHDVPIILTGVVLNDEYEGEVASRRTIIYTLDFDMHIQFNGPLSDGGAIIREVNADLGTFANAGILDSDQSKLETVKVTPTPLDVGLDSDFGFNIDVTPYSDSG